MKSPPVLDFDALYDDGRTVWRVLKRLPDGVHVGLVQVDDPTRRKTLSLWALSDRRRFAPLAPPAAATAAAIAEAVN